MHSLQQKKLVSLLIFLIFWKAFTFWCLGKWYAPRVGWARGANSKSLGFRLELELKSYLYSNLGSSWPNLVLASGAEFSPLLGQNKDSRLFCLPSGMVMGNGDHAFVWLQITTSGKKSETFFFLMWKGNWIVTKFKFLHCANPILNDKGLYQIVLDLGPIFDLTATPRD